MALISLDSRSLIQSRHKAISHECKVNEIFRHVKRSSSQPMDNVSQQAGLQSPLAAPPLSPDLSYSLCKLRCLSFAKALSHVHNVLVPSLMRSLVVSTLSAAAGAWRLSQNITHPQARSLNKQAIAVKAPGALQLLHLVCCNIHRLGFRPRLLLLLCSLLGSPPPQHLRQLTARLPRGREEPRPGGAGEGLAAAVGLRDQLLDSFPVLAHDRQAVTPWGEGKAKRREERSRKDEQKGGKAGDW